MRNPFFAYFDFMYAKGWLSLELTLKNLLVAVIIPAVVLTTLLMLTIYWLERFFHD